MRRAAVFGLAMGGIAAALLLGSAFAAPGPSRLPASEDFAVTGQLTQGGWLRGRAPTGAVSVSLDGRALPLAADGRFFAAFDRDAGAAATLTARLADGRSAAKSLTIGPRAWKIEHIPLGPKPGTPPNEAYRIRREREVAQIAAARSVDHPSEGWRQAFVWPVTGRISGRFGSQRIYNGVPGSYHSGLDIATGASGTPFVAPADGVVILAAQSPFSLEGRLLMIDHGMGLNSAFLHSSSLAVKVGDSVKQGQLLGRIGMTGRATGPHLHWSIKWREARLDPLLFLGAMPAS
ncbi:MAG: M23 family metallopeptidase [Novosphingobium sp.]